MVVRWIGFWAHYQTLPKLTLYTDDGCRSTTIQRGQLKALAKFFHKRDWKMKLSENLKACGFEGTSEGFEAMLLESLRTDFPTSTIDAVLRTPAVATRFCEFVREQFPSANLHDAIVLGTLMNIRRRKECSPKLIGNPSKVKLSKLLADGGCSMGVSDFRELVASCLETMCKGQSIHQVICHPREALALCEYIRSKSRAVSLQHSLILQVLLTYRKR